LRGLSGSNRLVDVTAQGLHGRKQLFAGFVKCVASHYWRCHGSDRVFAPYRDWEVAVPEVDDSVFIIPDEVAKNGQERIVVLNQIARRVVEGERGKHRSVVFTYRGERISRARNHAWKKARDRAGLPEVRVHDLRHTFGHRLRAAGVSFEDRQDLLGHKSGRITTHYSSPDLIRLLEAANKLCERRPATVLRVATEDKHRKSPHKPHNPAPQKDSGRAG